ncbi:MFS transporter [Gryllotalpicola protaetiae]|uniref:MFS transporter n=1 Tax=Gryllotalpicola protaetiae TaxID=2419771 RepID=UPI0013C5016B|nr:MFS transporter [Gryllotalpicola protaetiae]
MTGSDVDTIDETGSGPAPAVRRWAAVGGVALGTFILVTNEFLPVGLLPQISDSLHVATASAGLLVTAPAMVAAVAAPSVAVLLGRVDRRLILLGMTALFIAADLVSAAAPNLLALIGARLAFGLGIGGFWAIGGTVGPSLVGPRHGGRATALIFGGISVASIVGVPAGTALGQALGWRAAFLATAIVGAVALLGQLATLPKLAPQGRSGWGPALRLLRGARARRALLATVVLITGQFVAFTYLVDFLQRDRGLEPRTVAWLLLVYGLAGLVGNFGASPLLRGRAVAAAAALAAAIAIAAAASAAVAPAEFVLTITMAGWGAAYGAVPIAMQTLVRHSDPAAFDSGAPIYITAFQGSIAIGSVLGAALVLVGGDLTAVLSGALLALVSAPLVGFGRSRSRRAGDA